MTRIWSRLVCAVKGHQLKLDDLSPKGAFASYYLYTCSRCGECVWVESALSVMARADAVMDKVVDAMGVSMLRELERKILGESAQKDST